MEAAKMMMVTTLLLAVFSCIFLAYGAHGVMVPAVFVFGDSLFDVGMNNYMKTKDRVNFPHYGIDYPRGIPTGRFSNGYNGAYALAQMLGFKESPPPYLAMKTRLEMIRGANFASGGTGILDTTGTAVTLKEQLAMFKNLTRVLARRMGKEPAWSVLAKSIFILSTGNNDMFGFYQHHGSQSCSEKVHRRYIKETTR